MPHHAAGRLIEPPVSSPSEVAQRKAAVAAPDPPLDPPAELFRSQGLRGVLNRCVNPVIANSLRLVLPSSTAPAVLQPGDHCGIVVRHEVSGDAGAAGGADTPGPDLVLDSHRDAVHRAAIVACQDLLLGPPRLVQSLLPEHSNVGVELEVEVVDPLQVGLDHLHRRHLPALNEAGQRRHRLEGKFIPVHIDLRQIPIFNAQSGTVSNRRWVLVNRQLNADIVSGSFADA